MKKWFVLLVALVCLMHCLPTMAEGIGPALVACGDMAAKESGENDYIIYPVLANGGEHTEKINAMIMERAQIAAYQNVMLYGTGSTGLRVDFEGHVQDNVMSLVISAEGKMPVGRPSQMYYPITVDLETGEEIPFDALFTDADGAKAHMEETLENEVEETLSTHLENRSLFPVPFDRYTLDENGGITLYYEKDQLSFLSGFGGAVYFRFSQLEPYFDLADGSYMNRVLEEKTEVGYLHGLGDRNCIGMEMEEALKKYRSTVDSEFYPGGACYEVEDARLFGTVLIADENEETVIGLLCSRVDDGGIVTGKTTLEEAKEMLVNTGIMLSMDEATAVQYRVCAGESLTYKTTLAVNGETRQADYTVYADANGVVQYVRLMITE